MCLNSNVQKHSQKSEAALPFLDMYMMVDLTQAINQGKHMAKQNLFIGSLAYSTTDDSLKAHFEQIGAVASARVVTDRDSGRSKGFGFVEFEDESNNQKAVDELDGKELDGRTINVGLARPKEDRPRRDFGGNGGNRDGGNSFRQRSW